MRGETSFLNICLFIKLYKENNCIADFSYVNLASYWQNITIYHQCDSSACLLTLQ